MECSTVAGVGDAARSNKGGTELAAIALAWLTLDGLILRLLKFGLTYLLRKVFWVGRTKQLEGWKTPCLCVQKCGRQEFFFQVPLMSGRPG